MTKEYQMTQEELDTLLNACQASPCIKVGNVDMGKSAQENANDYWKILADKYGFVWDTARPIKGEADATKFTALERDK